jgi:hypothetical protein
LIERSEEPKAVLQELSELGLFVQLTEQYAENMEQPEFCLLIIRFMISCLQVGRLKVQIALIEALYKDNTNSFISSVGINLKANYQIFLQRATLRRNYVGFNR